MKDSSIPLLLVITGQNKNLSLQVNCKLICINKLHFEGRSVNICRCVTQQKLQLVKDKQSTRSRKTGFVLVWGGGWSNPQNTPCSWPDILPHSASGTSASQEWVWVKFATLACMTDTWALLHKDLVMLNRFLVYSIIYVKSQSLFTYQNTCNIIDFGRSNIWHNTKQHYTWCNNPVSIRPSSKNCCNILKVHHMHFILLWSQNSFNLISQMPII